MCCSECTWGVTICKQYCLNIHWHNFFLFYSTFGTNFETKYTDISKDDTSLIQGKTLERRM